MYIMLNNKIIALNVRDRPARTIVFASVRIPVWIGNVNACTYL